MLKRLTTIVAFVLVALAVSPAWAPAWADGEFAIYRDAQ
jgi:hypothetical protein